MKLVIYLPEDCVYRLLAYYSKELIVIKDIYNGEEKVVGVTEIEYL